ncbi:MAG: prepilin-type N-terminal cleavage/methylation domain-containing protein [Geminicoccaceae bacterium]
MTGRPAAGFTLIEVLVAFTVAGLLLAAAYRLIALGLDRDVEAGREVTAALLAQSLLVDGGPGLPGERRGQFPEGYRFRVTVRPVTAPPGAAGLLRIEATVGWSERDPERSVTLTTERLSR